MHTIYNYMCEYACAWMYVWTYMYRCTMSNFNIQNTFNIITLLFYLWLKMYSYIILYLKCSLFHWLYLYFYNFLRSHMLYSFYLNCKSQPRFLLRFLLRSVNYFFYNTYYNIFYILTYIKMTFHFKTICHYISLFLDKKLLLCWSTHIYVYTHIRAIFLHFCN